MPPRLHVDSPPTPPAAPSSCSTDEGDDLEFGLSLLPQPRRVTEKQIYPDNYARILPLTVSLPILVFIDMFAVALVVPLLFQYYKTAGITSASSREFLWSLFSTAQIVGGLLISVLSDAHILQRRTILFLSFGGSAVSYALLCHDSFYAVLLSRVLVGLVKHTNTVSQTLLAVTTTEKTRAKYMGRLRAASTVAWILGPTAGALLFRYVDRRAPAWTACLLFTINLCLASILLRAHDESTGYQQPAAGTQHDAFGVPDGEDPTAKPAEPKKKKLSIMDKLKTCFSSKALGSVVVTQLVLTWVTKATSYSQLGSFYEDMYDLEPYHRGYIQSYQQALQFIVQSALVGPILHWSGGERRTTCFFTALLAIAVFMESLQSLGLFIIVLCPIIALCFSMTSLSLQTMVTHVAPSHSIFSVLAALDVLQNAVSITVPFYRATLFSWMPKDSDAHAAMQGDPDPVSWIYSSSVHWLVAAGVMGYLLLGPNKDAFQKKKGT